ncbi:MAG: J domain-containing protein, partial [Myxococcales bacterium]|nr:J domain-containing protein [Myxococcales bacterium]
LARIIGELDYYQLLHLRRNAVAGEVKKAYHATSRAFHPDSNRHLDPELREAVATISKRVSEAYSVLRDPRRRQAYDRRLETNQGLRMQLAEAQAEAGRQASEERGGRTPQGRQFYRLAQSDLQRNDYGAAVRNLQTALTFEPGNTLFKEQLARAKQGLR